MADMRFEAVLDLVDQASPKLRQFQDNARGANGATAAESAAAKTQAATKAQAAATSAGAAAAARGASASERTSRAELASRGAATARLGAMQQTALVAGRTEASLGRQLTRQQQITRATIAAGRAAEASARGSVPSIPGRQAPEASEAGLRAAGAATAAFGAAQRAAAVAGPAAPSPVNPERSAGLQAADRGVEAAEKTSRAELATHGAARGRLAAVQRAAAITGRTETILGKQARHQQLAAAATKQQAEASNRVADATARALSAEERGLAIARSLGAGDRFEKAVVGNVVRQMAAEAAREIMAAHDEVQKATEAAEAVVAPRRRQHSQRVLDELARRRAAYQKAAGDDQLRRNAARAPWWDAYHTARRTGASTPEEADEKDAAATAARRSAARRLPAAQPAPEPAPARSRGRRPTRAATRRSEAAQTAAGGGGSAALAGGAAGLAARSGLGVAARAALVGGVGYGVPLAAAGGQYIGAGYVANKSIRSVMKYDDQSMQTLAKGGTRADVAANMQAAGAAAIRWGQGIPETMKQFQELRDKGIDPLGGAFDFAAAKARQKGEEIGEIVSKLTEALGGDDDATKELGLDKNKAFGRAVAKKDMTGATRALGKQYTQDDGKSASEASTISSEAARSSAIVERALDSIGESGPYKFIQSKMKQYNDALEASFKDGTIGQKASQIGDWTTQKLKAAFDALESVDWSGIGTKIANTFSGATEGLSQSGNDIAQAVTAARHAMSKGWEGADLSGAQKLFEQMKEGARSGLADVSKIFADWKLPDLSKSRGEVEQFAQIFDGLGEKARRAFEIVARGLESSRSTDLPGYLAGQSKPPASATPSPEPEGKLPAGAVDAGTELRRRMKAAETAGQQPTLSASGSGGVGAAPTIDPAAAQAATAAAQGAAAAFDALQAKFNEVKAAIEGWNPGPSIQAAMNNVRAVLAGTSFHAEGAAMMETLAAGIKSRADAAVAAVRATVQQMRNLLPHSPAKEGPLSDLDQVRFSETLAASIRAEPAVRAATAVAAGMRAAIANDNLFGGFGPGVGARPRVPAMPSPAPVAAVPSMLAMPSPVTLAPVPRMPAIPSPASMTPAPPMPPIPAMMGPAGGMPPIVGSGGRDGGRPPMVASVRGGGDLSLHYAPQINVPEGANRSDFLSDLERHKEEVVRLLRDAEQRRRQLTFGGEAA